MSEEELATCYGKQKFATWTDAHRVLQQMRRRRDAKLGQYHCKYCGAWHIGRGEELEERAAIMEYHGGMSREDAEREAVKRIREKYSLAEQGAFDI